MATNLQDLRSQLAFRPEWVFDPVPWWVLNVLDKQVIFDLARIQLDARKAILAAETKAIDESLAILKRAGATLAKK